MQSVFLSLTVLLIGTNSPAGSLMQITPAAIEAEQQFLKDLGVKTADTDLILNLPYQLPPQTVNAFVVPHEYYNLSRRPEFVNPSELIQDLQILEFTMSQQYAGWDLAATRGLDWERFFNNWKLELQTLPNQPIDAEKAFKYFSRLYEYLIDNHSGPVIKSRELIRFESQSAFLEKAPKGICKNLISKSGKKTLLSTVDTSQQPGSVQFMRFNGKFNNLQSGYAISWPQNIQDVRSIECQNETINLKIVVDNAGINEDKKFNDFIKDLSNLDEEVMCKL